MFKVFNRAHLSSERGLTLVEVMFAALILSVGMFSSVRVFAASHDGTLVAQRNEIALHIAQKNIEDLRTYNYSYLGLNGAAQDTADAGHALNTTAPASLLVRAKAADPTNCSLPLPPAGLPHGCYEQLATVTNGVPAGKVTPKSPFSVTQDGVTVRGHIYRYVTWRNEKCPAGIEPCTSSLQDTKRITVSVVLTPIGKPIGPNRPVWVSSVVINPSARPDGKVASKLAAATQTGANLFLYNKICGSGDTYAASDLPSADSNPTHNTATYGSSGSAATPTVAENPGYCENTVGYPDTGVTNRPNGPRRPDLMGSTQPTSASETPQLFNYSADTAIAPAGSPLMLSRSSSPVAGGLIMNRGSTSTCASNPRYSSGQDAQRGSATPALATQPNRWNSHAWSSKAPATELRLRSKSVFDFHAIGRDGYTGSGRLCVSLIRREFVSASSGVAFRDVVLADGNNAANSNACSFNLTDNTNWRNFRCTLQMTNADTTPTALSTSAVKKTDGGGINYWEVPGGSKYRVMLVVTVPSDSGADLVLAYDNPETSSFLQLSCDPDYCGI